MNEFRIPERVAVLETKLDEINRRGARMEVGIESTRADLQEIKDMINKGKGAWWLGTGVLGLIAGYVGTFVHKHLGG